MKRRLLAFRAFRLPGTEVSLLAVWTSRFEVMLPLRRNKNPRICWRWFFFCLFFLFQWSGTFLLSSTHVLREEPRLRRVLLATDIGLSWGAVIVIHTVPEHAGAAVEKRRRAAPGVWTKLTNTHTHEQKCSHLLIYLQQKHTCFKSQAHTPQGFVYLCVFEFYVPENRKRMCVARCIRHLFT